MQLSNFEVIKRAETKLKESGFDPYLAKRLYFDLFHLKMNEWIMISCDTISYDKQLIYEDALSKLLAHEPLEYITGFAHFYGYDFKVDNRTLIPRVETEELVYTILNRESDQGFTVVDIGTGSGAIGLTLLKEWKLNHCILTDISIDALNVVRDNAQRLNVDPTIYQGDLFQPLIERNITVDIIISNPPYISEDEINLMSASTLQHEPKSALFAHDSGLFFYKEMVKQLPKVLKSGGRVYFEIGFSQGPKIKTFIQECYPNTEVEILKDINGHNRMIYFKWDD